MLPAPRICIWFVFVHGQRHFPVITQHATDLLAHGIAIGAAGPIRSRGLPHVCMSLCRHIDPVFHSFTTYGQRSLRDLFEDRSRRRLSPEVEWVAIVHTMPRMSDGTEKAARRDLEGESLTRTIFLLTPRSSHARCPLGDVDAATRRPCAGSNRLHAAASMNLVVL